MSGIEAEVRRPETEQDACDSAGPQPQRPVPPAGMARLLVPFDGSAQGWSGVVVGLDLARRLGAQVVLVEAVVPPVIPDLDSELAVELAEHQAAHLLSEASTAARDAELDVTEVVARGALAGRPARAILHTAAEYDVGLIVMGTHGRTGLSRAFLGSVAEEVIAQASVPVVLVPPHCRAARGREQAESSLFSPGYEAGRETPGTDQAPPAGGHRPRLMVALDGTPESEAGLPPAVALALALDAEVDLVQALPLEDWVVERRHGHTGGQAAAHEYLSQVAARLQTMGVPATAIRTSLAPAVNVDVADALLHHAVAGDAALLILATHARRGLDRWRYGSVEGAVVARAALPVLVVRAALPVGPAAMEVSEAPEGTAVDGSF